MKVSLGTEELQTKALGNKLQVQNRRKEEMSSGGVTKKAKWQVWNATGVSSLEKSEL